QQGACRPASCRWADLGARPSDGGCAGMGRGNAAGAANWPYCPAAPRRPPRDRGAGHSQQRPARRNQRARLHPACAGGRKRNPCRIRQTHAFAAVRCHGRRMTGHPAIPDPRIGVLLINLGTPDAPEERAVRRYLAEFLSDRRVVEIHPIASKPILHGIILRTRPKKSAEAYNQVWTNEGSPLRAIAHRQAEALRKKLRGVSVHYAMRYGHPGIAAALENMVAEGCTRILAAPLYPPYCAATTATATDAVFGVLARMRLQPALRTLPPYYDDPLYIDALANNLKRQLGALDFEPERLLLSFHGMPLRTLEQGDPYHCHCQKTARLLGEMLGREVDI